MGYFLYNEVSLSLKILGTQYDMNLMYIFILIVIIMFYKCWSVCWYHFYLICSNLSLRGSFRALEVLPSYLLLDHHLALQFWPWYCSLKWQILKPTFELVFGTDVPSPLHAQMLHFFDRRLENKAPEISMWYIMQIIGYLLFV